MNIDPNTLRGDWSSPTRVRFGPGRITELAAVCKELAMARPLLVTDPGLAANAMVQSAIAANEALGLPTGIFSDIQPNPSGSNVEDGLDAFRNGNHDGVIAFGGGNSLDAGKAIAFMAGQDRPIWDFEDVGDNWTRADPDGIAPVVAVPTTAGTGSEVGRAAVILNRDTGTKKIIFHPRMLPGVVISDPELTVCLPPGLTAATGMDALAHCLEAYCATGFHPMAEGIAVEGLRLIKDWLKTAYGGDGQNLPARAYMLAAAAHGATAFQKGLGAIHALTHPIGAMFGTHHGLTNAVVMPYVLAFNRTELEDKLARLAAWLDLANPSFAAVMEWVLTLRQDLGIPHTLKDLGVVTADHADGLAEMAVADPSGAANPVPLTTDSLKSILVAALEGHVEGFDG